MSLRSDRGSITEYVLITILIGISVIFVAQRYGITLRGKAMDASTQIDETGLGGLEDSGGGESLGAGSNVDGSSARGSTREMRRGGAGETVEGGIDPSRANRNAPGGTASSDSSSSAGGRSTERGSGDSGTAASSDSGAASGRSTLLTAEETGHLPESDEEAAVEVLGFRITLGTAAWLALLIVAIGFATVRQLSQKQKKATKQAKVAARMKGTKA